jgi:hypothetical protein
MIGSHMRTVTPSLGCGVAEKKPSSVDRYAGAAQLLVGRSVCGGGEIACPPESGGQAVTFYHFMRTAGVTNARLAPG